MNNEAWLERLQTLLVRFLHLGMGVDGLTFKNQIVGRVSAPARTINRCVYILLSSDRRKFNNWLTGRS
ncbi:MAG: hypothetical protein KGL01_04025 [Betaproteobacteria bacterium]|nr:hypothetical protein [Betaproteobacteria bacterium]